MATIKQLNKQIETSNKRIDDFKRKIEMYRTRTIKACDAVNVSIDIIEASERDYYGYKIIDYNLPKPVENKLGFDLSYRITSNYKSMKENERKFKCEKRTLDSLIEQRNKMESDAKDYAKATAWLQEALEQAMVDFRVVWFAKMSEWYKNHYQHINNKLADARFRNGRAKDCSHYFTLTRGWSWCKTSRIMRYLESVCKSTGEIIMDDAARMDFDSYMEAMEQYTTKSWDNGIAILTDKCHKFGLNEMAIRVDYPEMTAKGFSAIITDGTNRIVDVRVIWAAEFSSYVVPHVRYIATQRTK